MSTYEYEKIQRHLGRVEKKVDHAHDMLHAIADAVADLAPVPGGMTADEVQSVVANLKARVAKIKAIAHDSPVLEGVTMAAGKPAKAVPPELTDALAELNAATNELAVVVDDLRAKVKGTMTPAEVADFQAQLAAVSARLKGLAVDPDNPVPPSP